MFYHPDLPDNPYLPADPNAVSFETASYLLTSQYDYLQTVQYALPYRVTHSYQNHDGALLRQEVQTYDWSAHTDVDYEYHNPAYPLKPTHVAENIENAGGMIRHALTSYNSFGDPLQQQLYDARDPDRRAVTEFEYHPDLPLPTRQTAWQRPDKNEGPVETVSIYGEQDGTENPHGNFMVAQQVLLEQGDPNTWAITHYKYDPTGRVTEKIDPRGFRTAYEYDEHHYPACVKVGPPGAEKMTQRFRHDALGQLLLQADHYGGVTLYDYDDFGFVWQIRTYTDPVAFTMDRSLFTVARYEAMTPDSTSRYGYDDFGNRTWEEKPAGGIVRTEYTRSRQPAKVTYHDYDDQQQLQEKAYLLTDYNSRGLKTGEEKYDALTDRTSYVLYGYDYLNRLTETWWLDYDDQTILKVTKNGYDGAGRKIFQRLGGASTGFKPNGDVPLCRETTFTYDVFDKVIKRVTAPATSQQAVTRYEYDLAGNRTAVIDPAGSVIYTQYDNANRKTADYFAAEYLPEDPNLSQSLAVLKTQTQYYPDSSVAAETSFDYDGSTILAHTEFDYDDRQRLVEVNEFLSLPDAPEPNIAVTCFDYLDPGAGRDNYETIITDAENKQTHVLYDAHGNEIKRIYPSGDYQQDEFNGDSTLKQKSVFNSENVKKWITYDYDGFGRCTKTTYPDGGELRSSYDGFGRRVSVQDLRHLDYRLDGTGVITYDYDPLGRVSYVTDPNGYEVRYAYLGDGQREYVQVYRPGAGSVIYTQYDNANRKTAEYFAAEYLPEDPNLSQSLAVLKTQTQYYPDSSVAAETSFNYDGATILAHTEFDYDDRQRLVEVNEFLSLPDAPEPNIAVTCFDYLDCGAGRDNYETIITDAENKQTHILYDAHGNEIKRIYPSGDYQQYEFNGDGTLKQKSVFNSENVKKWITYDYDGFGRCNKTTYPDGGELRSGYDGFGRRVSVQDLRHLDYRLDGTGVISYDYDPLGRTTCVADPNGYEVRYAYRGDGQREYVQVYRPGTGVIYALYHFYDYQGRLYFLRRVGDDHTTNLAIFAYDANGNRIDSWYPLAGQEIGPTVKLNYTHNRDNLLTSIITSSDDVTGEPNYCLTNAALDGLGRLTGADETITDLAGQEINHSLGYTYDRLDQLKAASISNIAGQNWSAQYGYDKAGNLRAVEVDGSASNRTFQGDRLLSSSGAESYALGWDENGQLTGAAAATLEYDWDGRLYHGQSGSDWLSLKYDPDGNRVAKSSSRTGSRRYIVDVAADLPVILLEINPANSEIVKSYFYADEQLICQHNGDPNTGPKYFYITDRIGSVRQVIDVNGCVKHLYSYGPFGKKLEANDDPDGPGNNFQFTGQYFDAEIDQYYLRARQYSPSLNIFTSRDPVSGNFNEPLTLHAYLYCLNDPVNRTDLSGDFSLLGTLGAGLNYGFKAYSTYSTYQNVKGYAEQLAEGVALRSILLDVAIDAGINYAGGKIFDAAVKGIGRIGQNLLNSQKMKIVRRLGEEGEDVAGIVRKKQHIPSYTGKAFRVPDELTDTTLTEVKNVANLDFTEQLQDYLFYSLENNLDFVLKVRKTTKLSGPLQKAIKEGFIILEYID